MKRKLRSVIYISSILLVTNISFSQTIQKNQMLQFANNLFLEGEYYRAITEYKRIIFYFPLTRDSLLPKIADCYFKGNQFEDAIEEYKNIFHLSHDIQKRHYYLFQISKCYLKLNNYNQSLSVLNSIINDSSSIYLDEAKYYIGFIEARNFNWNYSSSVLNSISHNHPWYFNAHELSQEIINGNYLPQKKPYIAGTLSAIIPGAGYWYANNKKIGLASFILNSLFAYSAYEAFREKSYVTGSTFVIVGGGWYLGNIWGSISKSFQYNRNVKNNFLKSLDFHFIEN